MTDEDKKLLLIDLSARLHYGVKGIITYDKSNTTFTVEGIDNNVLHLSDAEECYVEDFKPYLRQMSSMTEGEKEEFENLLEGIVDGIERWDKPDLCEEYDWLNAHHFDYRGLIEKGLAIAVTKENNPYK